LEQHDKEYGRVLCHLTAEVSRREDTTFLGVTDSRGRL
jgi:hypothetical protein